MDKRYRIIRYFGDGETAETEAIIDRVGAQLVSLKIKGVEVMFQGALSPETSQWKATAKNLFPNPGPLGKTDSSGRELKTEIYDVNGKEEKHTLYSHNGGIYHMGQHGFAQSATYEDRGGDNLSSCTMSIRADDMTYNQYPYDFQYLVSMDVNKNGLSYMSCVRNNDNKDMLAGMGWHPAFTLQNNPRKYTIKFKNLVKTPECDIDPDKEYEIYDSIILKDASVKFEGIISADVVLQYENEDGEKIPYITMHTEEPYLVLWSRHTENEGQENFICIEPWNTTPRQINNLSSQDQTHKLEENGAVIIAPGQERHLYADVQVGEEYIKEILREQSNLFENE